MKVRHFDSAWLLLFAACSFEPAGTNQFFPEVAPTSGASTTASTTGTDNSGGMSSSSSVSVDESGSDGSTSAPNDTSGTTGTTGATDSVCGDGVRDSDEVCDDGNSDEFDECTSDCAEPACDDGLHNGAESDLDCGGTCGACALCQVCKGEADCDGTMICNEESQCAVQAEIEVSWSSNCGSAVQGVTIAGLEAGTYQATASPSAGTIWEPPYTPPTTGYFYETFCSGVSFTEMRTPPDQRYADINTSFDNMESETETFEFAGGNLTCWHEDDNCGDNNGSVAFSIESICPG